MKRRLSYKHLITVCALLLGVFAPLLLSVPAYACDLPDGTTGVYQADGRTCCPQEQAYSNNACLFAKYINPAIALLSAVVGLIVVIAIVYAAIEYITSASDPQRVAQAKQRIINALIGLVAFILLYAFLQFLIPGGAFSGK